MPNAPDDWEITRKIGQNFTGAELAVVRESYRKDISPRDVARQLKCSTKAIQKHYRDLSDAPRSHRRKVEPRRKIPMFEGRFYHSDFEPS